MPGSETGNGDMGNTKWQFPLAIGTTAVLTFVGVSALQAAVNEPLRQFGASLQRPLEAAQAPSALGRGSTLAGDSAQTEPRHAAQDALPRTPRGGAATAVPPEDTAARQGAATGRSGDHTDDDARALPRTANPAAGRTTGPRGQSDEAAARGGGGDQGGAKGNTGQGANAGQQGGRNGDGPAQPPQNSQGNNSQGANPRTNNSQSANSQGNQGKNSPGEDSPGKGAGAGAPAAPPQGPKAGGTGGSQSGAPSGGAAGDNPSQPASSASPSPQAPAPATPPGSQGT